jgi:hypothetical protein
MKGVVLLTVKDTYWIDKNSPGMLVLRPDFSVPTAGWKECTEDVVVVRPDGQELAATAKMSLSHFNISDPNASIDQRWRVTVWLTDRTPEEVPVGSDVLVSLEVRDALIPSKQA